MSRRCFKIFLYSGSGSGTFISRNHLYKKRKKEKKKKKKKCSTLKVSPQSKASGRVLERRTSKNQDRSSTGMIAKKEKGNAPRSCGPSDKGKWGSHLRHCVLKGHKGKPIVDVYGKGFGTLLAMRWSHPGRVHFPEIFLKILRPECGTYR